MTLSRWTLPAAVSIAAALLTASSLVGTALAAPAHFRSYSAVSTNWAGYAVVSSRVGFKRVAGGWTQPAAHCSAGRPGYAAFWVGLGGYRHSAHALEQVGTESDCSVSGRASYYAWYELVPAPGVPVRLRIRPGDRIAARVSVSGNLVSLVLRDLNTGGTLTRNARMSSPDLSSAEWIAEAPSSCDQSGSCQVLPLANFGNVSFYGSSATATDGRSGSIGNSTWSHNSMTMHDDTGGSGRDASLSALAIPTGLTGGGSSFGVSWQQSSSSQSGPPQGSPFPQFTQAR